MADQPQGLDESERAELERLRAEQARAISDAEQDERIEEARRRMEPGDDLKMPAAQKIVLAVCAALFVCAIFWVIFAPK